MDETDRRIKRSTLKLIAISLALGFLLGFAAGAVVMYHSIDRVVVIPLEPGIEV
jgi:hypothetical protein